MAEDKVIQNNLRETVFAAQKETLNFFMSNKAVKYAFVKTLLDSNMTVKEIRSIVSISPQTVAEIRNRPLEAIDEALVDTLKGMEINKLNVIGAKMLEVLDDESKLKAMSGDKIAYAYKLILDARRLLENKSTSNIAVQINTLKQKFDDDAVKIEKILGKMGKKSDATA